MTITIIISLLIVGCYILTTRWLSDGQQPVADGSNHYAIVLGAKVNGTIPSLSLRYRLEAALDYANKYPNVKLILSGGQGPDEEITEATAMRIYLLENGVSKERLIIEEASTSTFENILFSTDLMPSSVKTVTIITSDYHLARSKKIAREIGYATDVVVAKTPKVVASKLRTRERLALMKNFLVGK